MKTIGAGATLFAQRGVSDTEMLIGSMADISGVTAVQGVNNAGRMRLAYDRQPRRCDGNHEGPGGHL